MVVVSTFASKYLKSSKRILTLLTQLLTISQVKQIQSHLTVTATILDPYAAGKIVAFYAIHENGHLPHALQLFLRLPNRSTFLWNTIIRAFSEQKQPTMSIYLYKEMLATGFLPNNYTFSFVLRSCAEISDVILGACFHAQAIRLGWETYDFVLNGLIHLYVSCGCVDIARKLFDVSSNRDVITWTALITGYVKIEQIDIARKLFDEMPEKNTVSWSAMISGYVQAGLFEEALALFNVMQTSGFRPNHAGIVGGLTACAFLGALDQGRWMHTYVDRNGLELDTILGTALIEMYAKCGCIDTAHVVFNKMPNRDVFAFTSLISGLANHGESGRAIELFARMETEGVRPNEVTFICILSACSRMGLVNEGIQIFKSMREVYGINPRVEHYGCLVDLLGRAGRIEEAKKVLMSMPMEPDSYALGALLNACRVHDVVDIGKEIVDSLEQRSLDHSGVYVLLSNIYASADQWVNVMKVRKGMEEKNVRKLPGCSLIEVGGAVCEFVAGHTSHLFMDEIMLILFGIEKHIKSLWLNIHDHNYDHCANDIDRIIRQVNSLDNAFNP